MNSDYSIFETWWARHDPHKDLHVVVELRVFTRKDEPWADFSNEYHTVDVAISVPEHIAFEDIWPWVKRRGVVYSEGSTIWWHEIKRQHPEKAKEIELPGYKVGVRVVKIKGYVHGDGTPYNTAPLQSDRVKRWLDKPDLDEAEGPWLEGTMEVIVDVYFRVEKIVRPFREKLPGNFKYKEWRELLSHDKVVIASQAPFIDTNPVVGYLHGLAVQAFNDVYNTPEKVKKTGLFQGCNISTFCLLKPKLVTADGRPFDLQPGAKDHINRLLGENEDPLYVKLSVNVNLWWMDNPSINNTETEGVFEIVIPVHYRDYDNVKNESWWENNAFEKMWQSMQEQYPSEADEINRKSCDEMVDISFEVIRIDFYDSAMNRIDTSTPEFQKKRLGQVLSDDSLSESRPHRPHPGLWVIAIAKVCTIQNAAPDGPEFWADAPLMIKVADSVPFEDILDWLNMIREDRPTASELWALVREQQPDLADEIYPNFSGEPPFIYFDKIEAYVHPDGTPYDVMPLQRDRVNRSLEDGVDTLLSLDMLNARQTIDEFMAASGVPAVDAPAPPVTPTKPSIKPPPSTPKIRPGTRPGTPRIRPGIKPRPKMKGADWGEGL